MGVRAAAHSVPPKFVPAMQDHPDDNFSSGTAAPAALPNIVPALQDNRPVLQGATSQGGAMGVIPICSSTSSVFRSQTQPDFSEGVGMGNYDQIKLHEGPPADLTGGEASSSSATSSARSWRHASRAQGLKHARSQEGHGLPPRGKRHQHATKWGKLGLAKPTGWL